MGLSLSSIGHVFDPIVHPVEDAVHSVVDNTGGLFSKQSSLLRLLANPADPVALGQTFQRTAQDGPKQVVRESDGQVRDGYLLARDAHRSLFDDTFGELWHGIYSGWHSFFDEVKRAWHDVGGEDHWNKLGNSIGHTVDKWGGEQRVVGWTIVGVAVVIYVILEVFTVGGASPAAVAILGLMVSFGLTQGLSPRQALDNALEALNINNNDNSTFTSIDSNPGNSSSGAGSNAGGGLFAGSGFGDLPPLAIAGLAVAGAVSVWFLFAR